MGAAAGRRPSALTDEGDVVDEVGFNMHPIVLGSGVPLFRSTTRRIKLDLIESRPIDGGCVLATYRVSR